jgi:outer membrane protein assembly factor BamB
MFGLMEITAQLDEPTKLAIIPTVVLPFTIVGMILTSLATWIAAFFGVKLKAEGPKRLFEVLMKPKILIFSVLANFLCYGAYKGGLQIYHGPYPLWWVKYQNSTPQPSGPNITFENSINKIPSSASPQASPSAALLKSKLSGKSISAINVVWESQLQGLIFGTPIISGSSLFTGEYGGRLLELDLDSGKVLRRFQIGKPVMASPVIWNNKIYVGEGEHLTHHARIYSFDLKTGTFLKAFGTEGHVERASVLAEIGTGTTAQTLLISPAGKDGLYAVDPETMQKVWQAPIGHVDTFPAVDSERVYVGTGLEQGFAETPTKVFALDIFTGNKIWEKALPTSVWGVPIIWNDVVCFGVGDVYNNTHYGQLTCYDKKTGKEYFAYNTTGALISQATIRGDHLIIADFYGTIYQFNLKTKSLDWTISVPIKKYNYASVVIDAQDRIILPGLEGLYIYSRTNQQLIFAWKPKDPWLGTYTNVVFYKDLWVIADVKGMVRALKPLE